MRQIIIDFVTNKLKPMGVKICALGLLTMVVLFNESVDGSQEKTEAKVYPRIQRGKFYMCNHKLFSNLDSESCSNSMFEALGDSSLPNVNKKFLFVVHITVDSLGRTLFDRGAVTEAGIKNAIRAAGGFYSKIGIEFEAEDSIYVVSNPRYDVMGSTGELEENAKLNAKQNRINLFVIDAFDKELEGAAGIAGGNYMHIASGSANAGTIAHETGHIFSLEHTFGTGDVLAAAGGAPFPSTDELVDGSNCGSAGDFVCDTPADPYIFPSSDATEPVVYFENCIFVYDSVDAKGFYYDPQPGNIMSYYSSTDCPCSSFLTDGQLRRVADKYYNDAENFSWW